jgi:hypothetical protein
MDIIIKHAAPSFHAGWDPFRRRRQRCPGPGANRPLSPVQQLERRRPVRRRRDPKHGRVLRASVTAKGLEVLDRCDRSMDTIESDMLRDVSPEVADLLGQTLASCAHAREATSPRLPPRP